MIWLLRHISIRLWITALFSMPVSIYIIFQLNSLLTGNSPVILFIFIVLFFFIISGLIMDLIGKKIINSLIKDGIIWERAGIYKRTEEKYHKALRVYDSFLISPFSARNLAKKLSEAIAKFTATSDINDANFDKATTLFIQLSPDDEHMALLWLKKLFHIKNLDLSSMDHDTLTIIAENHYNNPKILPLLTNIFIQLKRTDFTAQKIYKTALIHLKKESKKIILIQELIKQEDEKDIPSKLSFAKPGSHKKYAPDFTGLIKSSFQKLYFLLTKHEKTKLIIKFSFILLTFFLAIFLMFNTLTTLFKQKAKKLEPKTITFKAPAPVPEMLYTIQIAAFLSQPHAAKYTKKLTKKGLDARFVKVKGKNKTWFLVRISKFPDKASAAAYGQKLKRQGLIKDFFVANK